MLAGFHRFEEVCIMNWQNLAYGAMGIGLVVLGALVPAAAVLIPVGIGVIGNALPSLGTILIAPKQQPDTPPQK